MSKMFQALRARGQRTFLYFVFSRGGAELPSGRPDLIGFESVSRREDIEGFCCPVMSCSSRPQSHDCTTTFDYVPDPSPKMILFAGRMPAACKHARYETQPETRHPIRPQNVPGPHGNVDALSPPFLSSYHPAIAICSMRPSRVNIQNIS